MTEQIKEPWKLDTNNKYSEVVKSVTSLSTATLLLPVFMTRKFLGIGSAKPLIDILGCSVYFAWGLLGTSILASIFYQYLSAKWVRIAWGKEAGLFWSKSTQESTVEKVMEFCFWLCLLSFGIGLLLTIYFFANYPNTLQPISKVITG